MSTAPEWFPVAFAGLCFVVGWLQGALWHSKKHLADIRSHIRWIEEYTTSVNELLTEFAEALPDRPVVNVRAETPVEEMTP